MIGPLVRILAQGELEAAKRKIGALVFFFIALIAFGVALAFGFAALYLWLATMMPAWQAALSVAVAALVVTLLLWLVGRVRMRRRPPAPADPLATLMTGRAKGENVKTDRQNLGMVVGAVAVGAILGRILLK